MPISRVQYITWSRFKYWYPVADSSIDILYQIQILTLHSRFKYWYPVLNSSILICSRIKYWHPSSRLKYWCPVPESYVFWSRFKYCHPCPDPSKSLSSDLTMFQILVSILKEIFTFSSFIISSLPLPFQKLKHLHKYEEDEMIKPWSWAKLQFIKFKLYT
jgi:hypothetical protein